MGGGPAKDHDPSHEHLLIILPFVQSAIQPLIDALQIAHPSLQITYHKHVPSAGRNIFNPDPLPSSTYNTATILMTFGSLPSNPAEDAPHLRLLQLCSAGTDAIPPSHPIWSPDNGIGISTASGVHGPQIAEWAILTALAHTHCIENLLPAQRAHRWDRLAAGNPVDKQGQTVGILGYGSIGRQVGRCAKAMGMRVLAYTASPREGADAKKDNGYIAPGTGDPDGSVPDAWFSGSSTEELHAFLSQGIDWLVVAVPLTPKTRGLLGKKEFAVLARGVDEKYASEEYRSADAAVRNARIIQDTLFGNAQDGAKDEEQRKAKEPKPRPFLTNVARGPILVQEELVEALENGVLDGAALDVTDPEPLPKDSALWEMPNVIVTPHISGLSVNYFSRCFDLCGLNVGRLGRGEDPVNLVRKGRGY